MRARTDLLTVPGAGAVFLWSCRKALRHEVSPAEERLFRWFNSAPDAGQALAWAIMQSGSLPAVFVAASAHGARFGARRAIRLALGGTTVWLGTKVVKHMVGRSRPDHYLHGVVLRGQPQRGLGFPSGHAAVSTTLALVTTTSGPRRALAIATAALTGGARMYNGAHLPLDVTAGFSVGILAAKGLRSSWVAQ